MLAGIAETIGHPDVSWLTSPLPLTRWTRSVQNERRTPGKRVSEEAIEKLQPILHLGFNEEKLTHLQEVLKGSETGLKGVAELHRVPLPESTGHPKQK